MKMLIEKNDNTLLDDGGAHHPLSVQELVGDVNSNANDCSTDLEANPKLHISLTRQQKNKICNINHNNNNTNNSNGSSTTKPIMNISAYSMQGKRSHMEDFYDIGYQMKPKEKCRPNEWPYEYFYFGVFDGHGGCEAAEFAKKNLLKFITKQSEFWSQNDQDVMKAIQKGFADLHAVMKEQLSTWSRTNRILPSTAGTTASVLFIKNGKFYSGHVGDSRIVISRGHPETKQWISEQVTTDHKPESKSENARIDRAGGEVRSKLGVPRVVWRRPVLNIEFEEKLHASTSSSSDFEDCLEKISSYPIAETLVESYQIIPFLAIARSLGDFWSINPVSGQFIVSPEPDVWCRPIDEYDKCILLATDGLWNVMNSSQAVRFLQELKIVKKGKRDKKRYTKQYFATDNYYDVSLPKNDANHALSLVYMAYQMWERRRLRSDNITAIVAMLSDIIPLSKNASSPDIPKRQKNSIDLLQTNNLYSEASTIQLEQTRIFCEQIRTDSEPEFYASPESVEENDILEKTEEYLVFPPTVFDSTHSYIRAPKNYERLSNAKCKRLERDDDDCWGDSYIYIKCVSDDPADEIRRPTRLNKKNVEVRDSSAQASQPIHDFGQPWDQLRDHDKEYVIDLKDITNSRPKKTIKISRKA